MDIVHTTLSLLALLNIILTILTIVIGIKRFNSLGELKILILIPVLSFLQNLFVELIPFIENDFSNLGASETINNLIKKTSVHVYIFLEYTIIVFFLFKLFEKESEKKQTIILYSVSIISILYPLFFSSLENDSYFRYFKIINGIILQYLTIRYLYTKISMSGLSTNFRNSIIIVCVGILLSFSIIWPTSLIESIIRINFNFFYSYLILANIIGYSIFFTSLLIAFLWKK